MKPPDEEMPRPEATASKPGILALLAGLWKALRSWVFSVTLVTVSAVLLMGGLIYYRAEKNLLSIFLAYLPAWVVALPLLGTFAAGILLACWRSAALSAACATVVVLWLGGYSTQGLVLDHGTERGSADLTVMTYNRGQGSDKVLADCAAATLPDIAVFQDAGRRLARLAALPVFAQHRHTFQDGEYAILSRWPLLENQTLQLNWSQAGSKVWHAGTRSVVDWNGKRVVVYNIHFPTPRDLLFWYARRGTFLYGLLGLVPYTTLHARHQQYLAYWESRVDLAVQVAERLRSEKEPVIAMGDFNFPPVGQSYNAITDVLKDVHLGSSSGFGYTFPGNLKSVGRFVSPWLRIDHIFASSQWSVRSCFAYQFGASQHLPVVAVVSQK